MSKPSDTSKTSGNHEFIKVERGGRLSVNSRMRIKSFKTSTLTQIVATEESKEISKIINMSFSKDNIKSLFIFEKKLPFFLLLEKDEPIFHATGARLRILGPDKEIFNIGGTDTAEESLPKSFIQIIVPRAESFDFELIQSVTNTSVTNKDDYQNFARQKQKQKAEERRMYSLLNKNTVSLPFNEVEYIAFWALNHFIRQYCKLFDIPTRDLSLAEFEDGLSVGHGSLSSNLVYWHHQLSLNNFDNGSIDDDQKSKLSRAYLSSPDYSIGRYIQDNLNYLNYSAAVISMAQVIEHIAGSGNKRRKAILSSEIDKKAKQYLAEIILTRNNILHQKECAIKKNSHFKKARRDYPEITEMCEHQIYETYRPWLWYRDGLIPFRKYMETKKKIAGLVDQPLY